MNALSLHPLDIPPEQRAIREKCFHPVGTFIEFTKDEIEQSIPDRFEKQVGKYPDRLAVKSGEEELTYAELNEAANQVAWAILSEHGESQEPVALLVDQGVPAIIAILGVLKAGKTYVPLDPLLASNRTEYILKDSNSRLLVTNDQNLSLARGMVQDGHALLNIDGLDSHVSTQSPGLHIPPETACWIIYTSGSTGQPKGVVQNHRTVLHMTMNYTNNFHICADDRRTLFSSYSVHAGAFSAFMALLNGAGLHAMDIKAQGLSGMANLLSQEEITVFGAVGTVFRRFCDTLTGSDTFPKLRLIYLSGEQIYKRDVELYTKHFSQDCILVNRLGCTETDVISMYFVDKETRIPGNTVLCGFAPLDKQVLVIGENGEEVGSNETGEIAVRSGYLSPGYWNRPDLTQASFLPDPEGGDQRIYLTGDLGRILSDGCLEHLGRKDFQVKIRGYRVEAAEVEMALLDKTEIKEAVVVAREDRPGNPRLVAYLVPSGQKTPTISSLRSSLQVMLPDYMVPSAFVFLDALPILPNGKLDRRGLPAPGSARPELETTLVGGRTPVERVLVEVWAEVLGLDEVGVHDNFLELGGDSLLAGQVVSRVISEFRVDLPLRSLFQAPTVADMALAITQRRAKAADQTDIDRMLAELETLSAERAKELLAEESSTGVSHDQY